MAEAVLLGDPAVDDERGRLIVRLVAGGDDVEILAQRRQVGRRRVLHVANLDDVVDAFADEDLAGVRFDRDLRLVVGDRLRRRRTRSATPARPVIAQCGYVALPILLHGDPAEQAGLHLAVAFALFLLPFADLAQGFFDPIARDLWLFSG